MVNRAYKKSLTLLFHSEINVERKLIKRELAWYLFKFTVKSYPYVYQ